MLAVIGLAVLFLPFANDIMVKHDGVKRKLKDSVFHFFKRVTRVGWLFVIAVFIALIVNNEIINRKYRSEELRVKAEKDNIENEERLESEHKLREEVLQDTINSQGVKLESQKKQLSEIHKALIKSGLQLDSVNGVLKKYKPEARLSDIEVKQAVSNVKYLMRRFNFKEVELWLETDENGKAVYHQLLDAFTEAGFNLKTQLGADNNIEKVTFDTANQRLKVRVGRF